MFPGGRVLVHFTSMYGSAPAVWGTDRPVAAGHDAELEVPETLAWGSDIVATTEPGAAIAHRNDEVRVRAVVKQCRDDGVTTLRLGDRIDDEMLEISTTGKPPRIGTTVQARIQELWVNAQTV